MDFASLGIKIDSSEARKGAADLDALAKAGDRAEKSTEDLGATLRGMRGLFAGVIAGDAVRRVVQIADTYNTMNARLMLVTRSTSEFVSAQRSLFDISQRTRVGLEQTSDLFGSITRSTESLGVSQEQVLRVTETINKALIVSGTSAQSAQAALIQLGQGFAAGTLRGEELNSILEQTPRLARAIADGLGVPIGKLRELGQQGKLTGDQVFTALTKAAKDVDAEFERIPLTVEQATTKAANSWLQLIGVLDQASGATSTLAAFISETADSIGVLAEEIKRASEGDESVGALAQAFQYVIETVKVLWAEIKFVFESIGREIGAIAAQIVALANLDIKGFNAISEAVREDAERARRELDAYISSVLVLGRLDFSPDNQSSAEARRLGLVAPTPLPKARVPGGGGDKNKRDPIAQAKLAADLAEYKRRLAEFTAAFEAEEAILEARRSAGLVRETDYYTKRVELINRQTSAAVQALESEKRRIEQEKASGADAIRNRARIADLESEINRTRQEAITQIEVLAIREQDSLRKVEQAFKDAQAAADEYVNTLRRQNERDIAGMGRGDRQREIDGRRSQREDQFLDRRSQLDSQLRAGEITKEQFDRYLEIEKDAHKRALEEDERYWSEKLEKQKDWSVGAMEAIQNYYDQSQDVASQVEDAFTRAFEGMEDALVKFITTGKLDFKSLADSIIADITRIIVKQQILGPLVQALGLGGGGGGLFSLFGGSGGGTIDALGDGIWASAKGNVFTSPGLSAYSGQVVNKPTIFPFARGVGLMGEAGPEAILPLKRGADGKLGVEAGGGGNSMHVTIHQNFPQNTTRATTLQAASDVRRVLESASRNM
jgi:lambda family phage tail tape measure protein